MRLRVCLTVALGLQISGMPCAGADDIVALYQASWGGLSAGRIRLSLSDTPRRYRNEIAISSEGLSRLFTHFRATAVSEGKLAADRTPEPEHFDASYDLHRRRDRRLSMPFVVRAGAVFAERGPGDTSRKPPLDEEFRRNVIDPLSVITLIRQALRRGENAFTVPVYDGARRFDTVVRVLPRDTSTAPGLHLALTLRPIAGFKGKTSDDGDPDDAPRPVALTLSDDARLMPLSMSVSIYYLPLEVALTEQCEAGKPCTW